MKKILVIGMTTFPGGMERYIINWFEKMNKNIYKTYFLNQEGNQEIAYTDVITQNGGEIVYAIKRNGHFWEHYKEIQKIYKNQFDIIYYNTLDLGNVDFLIMAKLFNKHAKKIVHAHNSSSASKGIRYELIKLHTRYIKNISDIRLACSQVAGDWMFKGADYRVINNSIDLDKFKFDVQKKQEMLDKLGLKGKKVWGTVGRLAKQKNPLFIVEIMRYVHTVDKDVVFVHIGDGQLKSEMQAKIKEYGLEELYLLLGQQANVEDYYQVMDKFLLPSLYEGLPIVLIEAQAMGIECYVSSNVSVETDMKAGIYKSISLDKGASEWADIIMKDTIVDDIDRGKYVDFVRKQGFDLQDFSFMEVLN